MERSDRALMEFFGSPGSGGGGSVTAPALPRRNETDELLERIIAEEVAALHTAFVGGAEFAITGRESARDRVLHRLECSVLEPHLDRRAQWTDQRRARLAADPRFRLTLPALVTRAAAQQLSQVRSCKICWPNVNGNEPHPLRAMKASGLRTTHIDHVLSTSSGDSLGTILRMSTRSSADGDGLKRAVVEVVTSWHTLEYAPSELVYIWDLPTDGEAIERKMRLFARLGSGLSPAS